MKGRHSSIHVTKESIFLTKAAKVWASQFPCLPTCDEWKVWNSRSLEQIPEPIVEIEIGASVGLSITWHTVVESVSKMTSLTPVSNAKIVASSNALASASKGPKGRGRRLLKAAMTDPTWSWMITSTPIMLRWEKTAASTLTLYQGNVGGTQRPSLASLNWVGQWWASWYSYNSEQALIRISCIDWRTSPNCVLLRLNHTLHAVVMTSSISLVPMCCLKSKFQRKSMKSPWLIPFLSNGISKRFQTSLVIVQSQNKCPTVSSART